MHASDTWRYHVGTSAPDPNWKDSAFNDSGWQQGPGGFGYADGDDATTIPTTMSVYLRRSFNIVDLAKIEAVVLHMDYDDAFVAYLNGTEIARANIGTVGIEPLFNAGANQWIEAQMYQGADPPEFLLSNATWQSLLVQGNNILTIQVHNESLGSSDLSAIPFLSLGINDASFTYTTPPSWFDPPFVFTTSYLPIMVINTNGQTIVDNPDIVADFGVIDNGPGNVNSLNDPFNDYEGQCNIEIRGNSSQMFPKKSYGMETIDGTGADLDTIVLGFPKEEDWILHAPYSDKTLMRNVMVYRLAREMGQYATRTEYFELIINGEYRGVYVFMEKIKRDNDRVDVAKLDSADIAGDDVTGGYIFKIDKKDSPGWYSDYNIVNTNQPILFEYVYPDEADILPQQDAYIQAYVDSFEDAINDPTFYHPQVNKRYDEYIDMNSFVDMWILNEFSKNVDGFRLSSYFYKDKNSNGGLLKAGPVWDYNLSFGNGNYCTGEDPTGWMYFEHCDNDNPFWWDHMWTDTIFTNAIKCRWEELRPTLLSENYLYNMMDSVVNYLGPAVDRNYDKWDILGTYVWPNPQPYPPTYADEITTMKSWIQTRLNWIDNNIPGNLYCAPDTGSVDTSTVGLHLYANDVQVKLYPNPTNGLVTIDLAEQGASGNYDLLLVDGIGRVVRTQRFASSGTAHRELLDLNDLPAGIYSLQLFRDGAVVYQELVVRR